MMGRHARTLGLILAVIGASPGLAQLEGSEAGGRPAEGTWTGGGRIPESGSGDAALGPGVNNGMVWTSAERLTFSGGWSGGGAPESQDGGWDSSGDVAGPAIPADIGSFALGGVDVGNFRGPGGDIAGGLFPEGGADPSGFPMGTDISGGAHEVADPEDGGGDPIGISTGFRGLQDAGEDLAGTSVGGGAPAQADFGGEGGGVDGGG